MSRHIRIEPHQAEMLADSDTLVIQSDSAILPGDTVELHGLVFEIIGSEPLFGWGRFNATLDIEGKHIDRLREFMRHQVLR